MASTNRGNDTGVSISTTVADVECHDSHKRDILEVENPSLPHPHIPAVFLVQAADVGIFRIATVENEAIAKRLVLPFRQRPLAPRVPVAGEVAHAEWVGCEQAIV